METLSSYSWPGNIRELRNAIEYAFVLCPSGAIGKQHLPPKIIKEVDKLSARGTRNTPDAKEREHFLTVLRQAGGNQSEVARILGVSRVTVWKRIKKYGVDPAVDL